MRMAGLSKTSQSSFERGLSVLTSIAENGELSVEEIADELSIPISSAYRYVRTLREYAFIQEQASRYVLGWRLLEFAGRDLSHTRIAEIGFAVLRDVVEGTSETAVLTVRVGAQAMCLRQVESPHAIRYAFKINQLLPLHAGAGQRMLLAYAPPQVLARVLDGPLPLYTTHTHDRAHLLQDLELMRRNGWGTSHGELNSGAVAVAMPVFFGGEILCSLTVAGPENRCGAKSWPGHVRAVLRTACQVLSDAVEPKPPLHT